MCIMEKFNIGDAVLLKDLYRGHGSVCIILKIHKSSISGENGWISFTYEAITSNGEIINLTESGIDRLVESKEGEL